MSRSCGPPAPVPHGPVAVRSWSCSFLHRSLTEPGARLDRSSVLRCGPMCGCALGRACRALASPAPAARSAGPVAREDRRSTAVPTTGRCRLSGRSRQAGRRTRCGYPPQAVRGGEKRLTGQGRQIDAVADSIGKGSRESTATRGSRCTTATPRTGACPIPTLGGASCTRPRSARRERTRSSTSSGPHRRASRPRAVRPAWSPVARRRTRSPIAVRQREGSDADFCGRG